MARRTLEELERTLSEADVDLGSLILRDDGTIADPAAEPRGDDPDPEPLLTLSEDERSEVLLGDVLGEGGLGVVFDGTQRSLTRPVAVKTLRRDAKRPLSAAAFIREARVTGMLEHPNIVPVHVLGRGPDGAPWMVMKKVDGTPWRDRIRETLARPDHLAIHLPILAATCRAVEFAHDRGVLHRDLKPDNVMVGDYGEVTVLDWGLAVALDEVPVPGLPRARDVRRVVGTARYMAPEMATAHGARIGPPTDVYMLGSCLHEVLTGQPPHAGDTAMEILYSAYASAPYDYGPDAPVELAAIVHRAMAPEPEARFGSVRRLREALAAYDAHESSRALTQTARAQLAAIDPEDDDDAEGTALTECRFAFQQALELWPGNDEAARGLSGTVARLVERALARGELSTAEALIRAMDEDDPRLAERLARLREQTRAHAQRVAALEKHAEEQYLGAAARLRRRFGVAFGILFMALNTVLGVLELTNAWRLDHLQYLVASGGVALLVGAPALPRAPIFAPNRASRRLIVAMATLLLMQSPIFLITGWLGVSVPTSLALSLLQLGGVVMVGSSLIRPSMAWTGFLAALFGLAGILWPSTAYFAVGLSYFVFVVRGSLLTWDDLPTAPVAVEGQSRPER